VTDHASGSLTARSFRLLPRLLQAVSRNSYDLIFVGFYGYLLVPWLRRLSRSPIIFDAFVSNYDTLCFDRQQFRPDSLMGRLAFSLDRLACRQADKVLLDTASHRDYFIETFDLSPEKLDFFYVSCNEDIFHPLPRKKQDNTFQVFFYSSYLPLHGVQHIIQAAKLLEAQTQIHFRLIGEGPTYPAARLLADQLDLRRIDFIPPVPYTQLPFEIAQADLCLAGPFGETAKAKRVIPGKLFQFMAMARPAVAGNTAANQELLTHQHHAWLIPPGEAEALAAAIVRLKEDQGLLQSLAWEGYTCYQEKGSERVIRQKLYQIIENSY
jgi:glycosyltransferase involved in cell wall biosynthesis